MMVIKNENTKLPSFAGLNIAPAPLYYDGNSLIIKDEDWKCHSYNSIFGLNEGSYYFNFLELGKFFDSRGSDFVVTSGDINNKMYNGFNVSYLGYNDWKLITQTQLVSITVGYQHVTPRTGSIINGVSNCRYAIVKVQDVPYIIESGIIGLLLAPDDEILAGLSKTLTWNTSNPGDTNNIADAELQEYIDYGCAFFPAGGAYISNKWVYGGTIGIYSSASHYQYGGTSYCWNLSFQNKSVNPRDQLSKNSGYGMVRLVRTA